MGSGWLFDDVPPPPPKGVRRKAWDRLGRMTEEAVEVVEWWNGIARRYRLPTVTQISRGTARGRVFQGALKNDEFWEGRDALDAEIRRSSFLQGRGGKRPGADRPWRPTLAWLCTGDNWRKVLEGQYRDEPGPGSSPSGRHAPDTENRLLTPEERAALVRGEDS